MKEYKSFYKTVGGGEGEKCSYSTRLDTYRCGCQHNCSYCYARSLLSFRGLWDPDDPATADIEKVEKVIKGIKPGMIVRLGGMTDCFQPIEEQRRATYKTIQLLNKYGVGYLIVTKSHLVANDEYMKIYDKDLAHIQVTVTTLDDKRSLEYEKASVPSKRVAAILKLQEAGFDVAIRLSPLIDEFMDYEKLNNLGIRKAVVEFLRTNSWIEQWLDIDYSDYILKQGGYKFLRLDKKKEMIAKLKIPEISVCEDYSPHYKYWQVNVNPNRNDCCNLRRQNGDY